MKTIETTNNTTVKSNTKLTTATPDYAKENKVLTEENNLLKTKLANMEESYKAKCEECNKILEVYKSNLLRFKGTIEAVKILTKSYNLSLDLLLPNEEGDK